MDAETGFAKWECAFERPAIREATEEEHDTVADSASLSRKSGEASTDGTAASCSDLVVEHCPEDLESRDCFDEGVQQNTTDSEDASGETQEEIVTECVHQAMTAETGTQSAGEEHVPVQDTVFVDLLSFDSPTETEMLPAQSETLPASCVTAPPPQDALADLLGSGAAPALVPEAVFSASPVS